MCLSDAVVGRRRHLALRGQIFGSCIHHAGALTSAVGTLMIAVIFPALLTLLVRLAGLELLSPANLDRAGAGAVSLAAIVLITQEKLQPTQATEDFSKLFSHGTQQQELRRTCC